MKKVRATRLVIVEDSESVSRADEIAATGPEVKAIMAVCGT